MTLHYVLADRRDEVMQRWKLQAQGVVAAESMPSVELIDHLPEFLLEEVVAIRRKAARPDSLDLADGLDNLGLALARLGDDAAARRCHEEGLAIRRRIVGPDHLAISTSLLWLADGTNDPQAKRRFLEQALAIKRKALGSEHPDLIATLNNLGEALQGLGDLEGAQRTFEESIAICRKAVGPDNVHLSRSLRGLAEARRDLGDPEGALPLSEESLAIERKVRGARHGRVVGAMMSLASVLDALGDPATVESLLREAIAISEGLIIEARARRPPGTEVEEHRRQYERLRHDLIGLLLRTRRTAEAEALRSCEVEF